MAAYSIDLRLRVLRDADAGLPSDELAEKYSVSRAWVDRLKQRRRETGEVAPGASVIKCCYATTGMYMTAAAAVLRESANTRTSLSHKTTRCRDTKMSRRVSRRVASPACIAGVRISRPNFSAPCGRTKL